MKSIIPCIRLLVVCCLLARTPLDAQPLTTIPATRPPAGAAHSNLPANRLTTTYADPGALPGDTGHISFYYRGSTVTYRTVRAADGYIWLQQNLGAQQVATQSDDAAAYGDLFQWGRWDDGHQLRSSNAQTAVPAPNDPTGLGMGLSDFFTATSAPRWWNNGPATDTWAAATPATVTATDGCDPCKVLGAGWQLPSTTHWQQLMAAESISNPATAFSSTLRLPAAGVRQVGNSFDFVGTRGYYWTNQPGTTAGWGRYFYIGSTVVNATAGAYRGQGASIRCLKMASTTIDSVRINTQGNIAPIVTSSVTASQPAGALQLQAAVYPSNASQQVAWAVIPGTSVSVNASGLVTVPPQVSGISRISAISAADPTRSDTLRLQVYCRPNTGNSNFFKFALVSIQGTTLYYHTPLAPVNYNFIPEGPDATATLYKGQTYNLQTMVHPSAMSGSAYSYSLWIDYNRNGAFEAGEWTELYGNAGTADEATTVSFTVPAGATAGKTLMRLKTRLAGGDNSAASVCGGLVGSGHLQDFIVTLATSPTLPVNWLSFTAAWREGKTALLQWQTATETSASHYQVQRSYDGSRFEPIGRVAAAGNSTTVSRYTYSDAAVAAPAGRPVFYRLQQVDKDGQQHYSSTVRLPTSGNPTVTISPNPVQDYLRLRTTGSSSAATVAITDLLGRTVLTQTGLQQIAVTNLPAGVYHLRITTDKGVEVHRFIKK